MMRFDVVTLFPEMVAAPFRFSMMARAQARGLFSLHVHDLRDWAEGRHRVCDDYPFGGGEGMVMKVEPVFRALKVLVRPDLRHRTVLMSPGGARFDQVAARRLGQFEQVVIVCGHYQGVDERVRLHLVDEEISIGDYVLSGGELPAMVVVETVSRLIPGVVGREDSVNNESFEQGILDHPYYTRPRVFEGMAVPEILLSGDHGRIAAYERQEALRRTWRSRPDLLTGAGLSASDREFIKRLEAGEASFPEAGPERSDPDEKGPANVDVSGLIVG